MVWGVSFPHTPQQRNLPQHSTDGRYCLISKSETESVLNKCPFRSNDLVSPVQTCSKL